MTPVELCEPIFQKVCLLNTSARYKVGRYEFNQVRSEFKSMLDELSRRAKSIPELAALEEKIRRPMIYFIDSMMIASTLPLGAEWPNEPLAAELLGGDVTGDHTFFELMDAALADRSEAGTCLIPIFYTAIGLGFTGEHQNDSPYLQSKMLAMSSRMQGVMDGDPGSRICPEAYEHLNTDNLIQRPGIKVGMIVLTLVLLIGLVLVVNVMLYKSYTHDLKKALVDIVDSGSHASDGPTTAPAPTGK